VHGMSSSSRTHDPPWKMMVIGIRWVCCHECWWFL
jgi:hypothetical protein